MVLIPLPDYCGSNPEPEWYTPEGRALLRRIQELAAELNLSEEELIIFSLDEMIGRLFGGADQPPSGAG